MKLLHSNSRQGRLRLHLSIVVAAFFGLTLLFRTRTPIPAGSHEPVTEKPRQTTSTVTATTGGSEDTTSQSPPTTMKSETFDQLEVRKLIRSQGTFIPIEISRTWTHNYDISNETISKTLDILDQSIHSGRKLMAGDDPFWNTTHPKRLLIVTSWRSGSTFLGTILAHHPAVFYHYEPLMYVGTHQIRTGEQAAVAVQHLHNIFHCNYSNPEYLRAVRDNTKGMLGPNHRLWGSCLKVEPKVCTKARYLRTACKKFPVLVSKVVRLRLRLARHLLEDEQLAGLKILFLVRDPRGTINSRIGVSYWCGKSEDCINPRHLCQDIDEDLDAYELLSRKHPHRMMMVQYETLAENPHKTMRDIFRFADLSFLKSISETIRQHTSRNLGNAWATYRKSSERIDLWRKQLSADKVTQIQDTCISVLKRLNYSLVHDAISP